MIDEHHGSTATYAKVHEMLARPSLRHYLLGQVACPSADKIDLDLAIGVFGSKKSFAHSRARLPVDRDLAFLFSGGYALFPILLPVAVDGSGKRDVEKQCP